MNVVADWVAPCVGPVGVGDVGQKEIGRGGGEAVRGGLEVCLPAVAGAGIDELLVE